MPAWAGGGGVEGGDGEVREEEEEVEGERRGGGGPAPAIRSTAVSPLKSGFLLSLPPSLHLPLTWVEHQNHFVRPEQLLVQHQGSAQQHFSTQKRLLSLSPFVFPLSPVLYSPQLG
ncbi:unnamed protein product [Closterium sp. NIES-54]